MQNRGDTVYLNDLDGQSSRAAEIERLEKLARMLDASVRLPFTNFRVGADSIVGLIPGIGDLTTSFFSSWILYQAWQMGVSTSTARSEHISASRSSSHAQSRRTTGQSTSR